MECQAGILLLSIGAEWNHCCVKSTQWDRNSETPQCDSDILSLYVCVRRSAGKKIENSIEDFSELDTLLFAEAWWHATWRDNPTEKATSGKLRVVWVFSIEHIILKNEIALFWLACICKLPWMLHKSRERWYVCMYNQSARNHKWAQILLSYQSSENSHVPSSENMENCWQSW